MSSASKPEYAKWLADAREGSGRSSEQTGNFNGPLKNVSILIGVSQKVSKARAQEETQNPTKSSSGGVVIKRVKERLRAATTSGHSKPVTSREQADTQTTTSNFVTVNASDLRFTAIPTKKPPVPTLSHGLERVLFNPGVYQLQDPRSRVYNFDPYLQNIMPVQAFDFSALTEYVTSSEDAMLVKTARKNDKKYVGSTSSMSAALAHFHYLISQWRPLNFSMLSKSFPVESSKFTELLRTPAAIILKHSKGSYAIDADKEFDRGNILQFLGKSMEKLLVLDPKNYEKYRRSSGKKLKKSTSPESYHYSTLGDFLMRSQLDAYDPRLPGTGMFDLKTRAVISIRMDVLNHEYGSGYQIKNRLGQYESFEREYYDMIRAAFLKYSTQVRMGRMDGIFVAYHNTERIFGFQYVSLDEMDFAIHGQEDTILGDQEFVISVDILNKALDRAIKKFPDTSLRLHFETRDAATPFMYIFAEPITDEQITQIQSANKAELETFERKILNNDEVIPDNTAERQSWSQMEASIQQTMHEDELEVGGGQNHSSEDAADKIAGNGGEISSAAPVDNEKKISDEYHGPLLGEIQSDDKFVTQADTPFLVELDERRDTDGQVLAMVLSLRNKINDSYVLRPEKLTKSDKWSVEYSLVDVPDDTRAWSLYQACVNRRQKKQKVPDEEDSEKVNFYVQRLRDISKQSQQWRQSMDELDSKQSRKVLGKDSSWRRPDSVAA